jgi:hypothetical protein
MTSPFNAATGDLEFALHGLADALNGLGVPDRPLPRRQALARTSMLAEIDVARAAIGRAINAAERAGR